MLLLPTPPTPSQALQGFCRKGGLTMTSRSPSLQADRETAAAARAPPETCQEGMRSSAAAGQKCPSAGAHVLSPERTLGLCAPLEPSSPWGQSLFTPVRDGSRENWPGHWRWQCSGSSSPLAAPAELTWPKFRAHRPV